MPKAVQIDRSVKESVKSELFDALRESLTSPQGKSKKSFVQDYVGIMLKEAKSNPNSAIGTILARQLLTDGLIEKLDAETDKYLARDIDFNEYRLLKTLYKEQQQVYTDPASKIIVIGSRRIGKTELSARLLVKDILKKNHHALYLNTNFDNAINQCWPKVIALAESLSLPIVEQHKDEGLIKFLNGSDILFKGNSDKSQADKRQGFKYSCVIIDEVQSQCNLPYLMDTILRPAMADYEDAKLICIGTPPRVPHTRAEQIWKVYKGWSKYSWDMSVNPYIKNYDEQIKSICEEKGCTVDAPFIQREWMGKFVYDTEAQVCKDALLYKESEGEEVNGYVKNLIMKGEFKADFVYGGIDWGGTDYNAITTVAWDKKRNVGYVLRHFKFNQSTATEIIEKCKQSLYEAQDILSLSGSEINNVRYYADHNIKSLIFELSNNYNFPIQLAYKHDKIGGIQILADLLKTHIYTPENSPLTDEYEMAVYKRDEETDAILPEVDDDLFHPDSLDSLLYASRAIVQFENPLGEQLKYDEEDRNKPTADPYDDSYDRPENIGQIENDLY